MEIERVIINRIEGKRKDGEGGNRFSVKFDVEKIEMAEEKGKIEYGYKVEYDNGSKIEIEGAIFVVPDEEIKKAAEEGKKDLSTEKVERLINTINYVGTTNAVLVARALGLLPPVRLPILRYNKKG